MSPTPGVDVYIDDEPNNVIRPPESISASEKGAPGGVATLDANGHVPGVEMVGVPVFVQAAEPVNPPSPSVWIPLDGNGAPMPSDQWQVFV